MAISCSCSDTVQRLKFWLDCLEYLTESYLGWSSPLAMRGQFLPFCFQHLSKEACLVCFIVPALPGGPFPETAGNGKKN